MARKTHNHRLDLPALELDCMRMLWALGQATVGEIRARLVPDRPLAYTTVMTVMDHLAKKSLVERERQGRAYLYRPAVSEHAVREHALEKLARNFFVNSRDRLRSYLEGEISATANRENLAPARETRAATRSQESSEIDPSLL